MRICSVDNATFSCFKKFKLFSTYERTATVIIISSEFPFLKLNFIHILSFYISYILTNVRKKEYGIPKISQNVAQTGWREGIESAGKSQNK